MSDAPANRLGRGRLLIAGVVLLGILLALLRLGAELWVDISWHREVGYLPVHLRTLAWIWGVRLGATVFVAGVLFLNLRFVAKRLGALHIRRKFGNLEIAERVPQRWVNGAVLAFSGLLGLWFGATAPEGVVRSILLWVNSGSWGVTDPFLGADLSWYVFTVPVLRAAVTFLLIFGFLLLTVVVAGYAATGALQFTPKGVTVDSAARRHLGAIVALFLVLLAARAGLARSVLLLMGNSDVQGIFGFTDANARLPGLRVQAVLFVMGAVGVVWATWKNKILPGLVGGVAVLLAVVVVGQAYPAFVQRFQVVPNELARETPYIERAIEFTRIGFGLDEMETRPFEARAEGPIDWDLARAQFDGLPVWSHSALLTALRSLEARFRYYDFPTIAFDRYGPPGEELPVGIAVREIDALGIEDPNWQNLHLRERYVSGNGVVAVDATGKTGQGQPDFLLSRIPPELDAGAPEGLALDRPAVFVGTRDAPYAIVNATDSAFTAPDGSIGLPGVDFPDGIRIGGFFNKLVLAWYLQESNLLFSSEVRPDARLVLRRGVRERVSEIAPFLRFPEDPYPVVRDGGVVWVLEGFTTTPYFPLARAYQMEVGRPVRWVRNSVKVTVDAVTGAVDFWRLPVRDPILDAWDSAFPELFRPYAEMPQELRDHLRYAESLLDLQSSVLLQFHQDEPPVFFGQQDVWAVPQELASSANPVPYRPEYGILRMPGDEQEAFQLVTSFVPAGRPNLTAMLSGVLDPDGTPRLRLFEVPVEDEFPGPRQVEALVEQDPVISQQFSLWRTGGSRVWTGHLHLVPVGDRLVYMEPVFLAAEEDAIPELRRFVVSDGRQVVMEETLEGAILALAARTGDAPGRAAPAADPAPTTGQPAIGGLDTSQWPARALDLLETAESRARAGDWAGFGSALSELRALLRTLDTGGASGGGG